MTPVASSANAAQTGAGGEVDPFGDGGVCHAPVALEQGDDLLVGRIKVEHAQRLRQAAFRRRNRASAVAKHMFFQGFGPSKGICC